MSKEFESLKAGLEEALAYAKGEPSVVNKTRVTKIWVNPVKDFNPKEIKEIRQSLHLSQAWFAETMGVSVKTVEAWEAGTNRPSGSARRLLEIFRNDLEAVNRYNIVERKSKIG